MKLFALSVFLSGCAIHPNGPFITDVSSTGSGVITVRKCFMYVNEVTNIVNWHNCKNYDVNVVSPDLWDDAHPPLKKERDDE